MKNADIAMYQAKAGGRSTFRFFDPSMNQRALLRLEMEASLRRALENGEFLLYFQPKVHVPSGRLCGAEALIRWRQPGGELVSPADFIPVAEETGLIVPIGYWVLEEACANIRRWREAGMPDIPVSVNLSVRQFRDEALVQRIEDILARHGVTGESIEVELTESAVMEDPQKAIVTLQRLRRLGLSVSVDDFGTGYSSLAYLKRFPISAIKIDRSFVADLGIDPEDAAIVQTIIALARTLRLDVVAEGVETDGQLAFLSEVGCDVVQGYYYSRPLPPDEYAGWLRRRGAA
jgi:EAL domain-containing protein (putative c-di-GMP-specific phosphodiesterase class I)